MRYVLTFNDAAIIVFRNTDDRADWFVNLDTISAKTRHGDVHKGFVHSYQPLKRQIITLLRNNKPKHLWITGHSLGGALAVVCAYDLVENEKQELDGIITFGHLFGLPAPVNAAEMVMKTVAQSPISKFEVRESTSDLVLHFAGDTSIDFLNLSCGYEGWRTVHGQQEIVCMGGGRLAEVGGG
jgi:hypothetical protein